MKKLLFALSLILLSSVFIYSIQTGGNVYNPLIENLDADGKNITDVGTLSVATLISSNTEVSGNVDMNGYNITDANRVTCQVFIASMSITAKGIEVTFGILGTTATFTGLLSARDANITYGLSVATINATGGFVSTLNLNNNNLVDGKDAWFNSVKTSTTLIFQQNGESIDNSVDTAFLFKANGTEVLRFTLGSIVTLLPVGGLGINCEAAGATSNWWRTGANTLELGPSTGKIMFGKFNSVKSYYYPSTGYSQWAGSMTINADNAYTSTFTATGELILAGTLDATRGAKVSTMTVTSVLSMTGGNIETSSSVVLSGTDSNIGKVNKLIFADNTISTTAANISGGDMTRATYDTDVNSIVDNADHVNTKHVDQDLRTTDAVIFNEQALTQGATISGLLTVKAVKELNLLSGATIAGNIDIGGVVQAGSGNINLTNATGNIDGDIIQDDTIDDDSLDFTDITGADFTLTDCNAIGGTELNLTNGATVAGRVDIAGVIEAGSGNNVLTNPAGLIDGDKIQDDTIDDDSLNFTDITGADITLTDCGPIGATELNLTNGATIAGNVDIGGLIQAGSGNVTLTNAAGNIDGDIIQNDTIDDDSLDFADITGADFTLTDCNQIGATELSLSNGATMQYLNVANGASITRLVSDTIDTGEGATECYAQNQDMQTSDSPSFVSVKATGNKYGYTANGQTIYQIVIATSTIDTFDYNVTEVNGKAGWGVVNVLGHASGGQFSFSASGAITLSNQLNLNINNGNDTTLNVYDAASGITIENQLGGTYTIMATIWYID